MRMSDWSSDVCSSDLLDDLIRRPLGHLHEGEAVDDLDGTDLASLHARLAGDGPDQVLGADPGDAPGAHEQPGHPVRAGAGPGRLATGGWAPAAGSAVVGRRLELGRASCRERVCQYVSISVVAVSL